MKFKHLIIVSLIMTILTMGIVSATEDVNASDTLTIEEIDEQTTVSSIPEDSSLGEDEKDEGYYDVSLYVYDTTDIDESSSQIATVYDEDYLNGTVIAVIDDNDTYVKSYDGNEKDILYFFDVGDLKKTPSFGIHKVNITYQKNGFNKEFNMVKNVNFKYQFSLAIDGQDADEFEEEWGVIHNLEFQLPENANGVLTFKFASKTYNLNVKGRFTSISLDFKDFKVGQYVLEAQFKDKTNKYPIIPVKMPVKILPKIYTPLSISFGEKDVISLDAEKNAPISVILYQIDEDDGDKKIQVAKVSGKTRVEIPVEKLLARFGSRFYLNYTVNGVNFGEEFGLYPHSNPKNVKSSISKKGDSVTVEVKCPKKSYEYDVYLDDVLVKSVQPKNGKMKISLSKLSVGKHKIKIEHNGDYSYSKTFWVTVKAKDKVSLTLKKVNIKKSAKKLVLKATLKLNKKAKKGLKVTFKFNGKKFTAKTNKNGVAKITVKKNVLKKLKVGKKVKYSVKYSFKTISQKVKVKK